MMTISFLSFHVKPELFIMKASIPNVPYYRSNHIGIMGR
jgi:hypothetical protein